MQKNGLIIKKPLGDAKITKNVECCSDLPPVMQSHNENRDTKDKTSVSPYLCI